MHIKSRLLLPIEDTADTDEPEDPRLELVMKLLEYKTYKDAALALKEKHEEWSEVIPRTPFIEEESEDGEEPDLSLFDLNLFDLLTAFNKMLEKGPPEVHMITRETLTVKDKMNLIIETMKANDAVRFESLFKGDVSLAHFLVTFIALLELIKLGLARCYQKEDFACIWIISPEAELDRESLSSEEAQGEKLNINRTGHDKPISATIRDIVTRSKRQSKDARMKELAMGSGIIFEEPVYHGTAIPLPETLLTMTPLPKNKMIKIRKPVLPQTPSSDLN